jgi:hypothetical protein
MVQVAGDLLLSQWIHVWSLHVVVENFPEADFFSVQSKHTTLPGLCT